MSLPPPDCTRKPMHTRSLSVEAFVRDDGQWDLEAELIDVKSYDFSKHSGDLHPAGAPVHQMQLRVTINDEFEITDAVAAYDVAPYQQHCMAIAPDYRKLIGLNLMRGFRNAVKERFGRTAGCTHMTELSYLLPTVAIQSRAGRITKQREKNSSQRPFQLEGCHALQLDGEVAREFYPKWYTGPAVTPRRE